MVRMAAPPFKMKVEGRPDNTPNTLVRPSPIGVAMPRHTSVGRDQPNSVRVVGWISRQECHRGARPARYRRPVFASGPAVLVVWWITGISRASVEIERCRRGIFDKTNDFGRIS